MADVAIVQEWIEKADEDFEFVLVNLKEGKPYYCPNLLSLFRAEAPYLFPTKTQRARRVHFFCPIARRRSGINMALQIFPVGPSYARGDYTLVSLMPTPTAKGGRPGFHLS